MSSIFGNKLKISIFGQSHGEAIGVIIDSFPAGVSIDTARIEQFCARRAPGGDLSSERCESDKVHFLSGIVNGKSCGAPICVVLANEDARHEDYPKELDIPRPSHADYTAHIKYGGYEDLRGGGHLSGRLTAPLCVAGAICLEYLSSCGTDIASRIFSIGKVFDKEIDYCDKNKTGEYIDLLKDAEIPVYSPDMSSAVKREILNAKANGDSVGGCVECIINGVPAGIGDPIFDGVENNISKIIFSIPGVRGIEFGCGFKSATLLGSENNDPFEYDDKGRIKTKTNKSGGVLGGITNGMPINFKVAFKPTPSIASRQQSVSLSSQKCADISVGGRHDPCIALRALPCVEAAAAIALCDMMI